MTTPQTHMLLLTDGSELSLTQRIWGTGGWYPPEAREAVDWLTFARLAGWSVSVADARGGALSDHYTPANRWIVLACEPEQLDEGSVEWIATRLRVDPVLFVARAAPAGSLLARLAGAALAPAPVAGRRLVWQGAGPSRRWTARSDLRGCQLDLGGGASPWLTLDGTPIACARRIGAGIAVTLGFHPSAARDIDGSASSALRHLLIWGALQPVVWLDFARTMVLRMDDPGGAQNVHLRSWRHPKLSEAAWAVIADDLRQRNARLSVAYVSGWVDDGDPARGDLFVRGQAVPRTGGQVHASPDVRYVSHDARGAHDVHDYESEYRGVMALKRAGAGDVELHGYTHMHPDGARWAAVPDRYTRVDWFRELGPNAQATILSRPPEQHPLALGMRALSRHFDTIATTLVSPGDQWTNEALGVALDQGLQLVSSYYLALRHDGRFCWSVHSCAPYLDEPSAAWFDSGMPVVGYFHDREPASEGTAWLARCLDRWRDAGARNFIDFRELAGLVERRYDVNGDAASLRLSIGCDGAPALVRPFPLMVRVPGKVLPARMEINHQGARVLCSVESIGDGHGRIVIPG